MKKSFFRQLQLKRVKELEVSVLFLYSYTKIYKKYDYNEIPLCKLIAILTT